MIGGILIGVVIGYVIRWIWSDREGFRDHLLGARDVVVEHAPTGEQTASAGKATLAFIQKYWLILLIVIILAVVLGSSAVRQATQVPTIQLGLNQLTDGCGVSQNVNITVEDVRRGQIVIGVDPKCRRLINLSPK